MRQATHLGVLTIGGWNAAHKLLPAGAKYFTLSTGHRTREDIGYLTLWIKGHIEGLNLSTGEKLHPRKPWTLSSELPPLSIGRVQLTALVDSEWLCFDGKINDGKTPNMKVVQGEPGAITVPSGHVLHELAPGVQLVIQERIF